MGLPIRILNVLRDESKMTPAMLRKKLQVSTSAITNIMWTLKDLKLVENVDHGLYSLTLKGTEFLKELKK